MEIGLRLGFGVQDLGFLVVGHKVLMLHGIGRFESICFSVFRAYVPTGRTEMGSAGRHSS